MGFTCLLCNEEGADIHLIKLHENTEHYSHISCLDEYYTYFRCFACPLCMKPLDGVAEIMMNFNFNFNNPIVLDRLDLFEMRLDMLADGDYRYRPRSPEFYEWAKKCFRSTPSTERLTSVDFEIELRQGISSMINKNQVALLQLLLNLLRKANFTFGLLDIYRRALQNTDKTCARMILETVLSNQVAFARNDLCLFLLSACCNGEMESASLILKKGIGVAFRKDVILSLHNLSLYADPDTNMGFYEFIDHWPLEELDYGLRCAARNGYLKCCRFLLSKGASIRRAGVGRILLKRCIEEDDRNLLQYVSQCFRGSKVEAAKSRKGKWTERVKLHLHLKLLSLRVKLCRKPYGY